MPDARTIDGKRARAMDAGDGAGRPGVAPGRRGERRGRAALVEGRARVGRLSAGRGAQASATVAIGYR
ncbi:MAG: hypothetical protein ACK55I_25970, partial [bacterium]